MSKKKELLILISFVLGLSFVITTSDWEEWWGAEHWLSMIGFLFIGMSFNGLVDEINKGKRD